MAVKCATITPNAARVEEYDLKQMWKSPNGTIRAMLDGTVFRTPILVKGIEPCVRNWVKAHHHRPSCLWRRVQERRDPRARPRQGRAGATRARTAREIRELVHEFDGAGVAQGMHNLDALHRELSPMSCFEFALDTKQDLWFATKDTISKKYDHRFKDIFQEIYDDRVQARASRRPGIDVLLHAHRRRRGPGHPQAEGGFIWACKNYDGDVMSDMVSTRLRVSLAMMTSRAGEPRRASTSTRRPTARCTRHYYKHLKGEETSTNPVATIFAWTGALRKRGELDGAARPRGFRRPLGSGYPGHHRRPAR